MSLVDNYREELKSEGVDINIHGSKIKKDRTKLLLIVIGIVLAVIIYYIIFNNYNACTIYASSISSSSGSSTLSGSFYLKCGTDAIMYSVSAALLIFIVLLISMKIIKNRKQGKVY